MVYKLAGTMLVCGLVGGILSTAMPKCSAKVAIVATALSAGIAALVLAHIIG